MKPGKRFGLIVAPLAILSFICFIQLDQYIVEKTGPVLWWVLGVVLGLIAIQQLYVVIKQSGGDSSTGAGAR